MNLVGESIGNYRLNRIIGEGGTSVVYEGQHHTDSSSVAIKILLPSIAHNPIWKEQFAHEFELVAGLGHPCIVPIYQFGVQDEYVYLIQRLMDAGSLMSRIDNHEINESNLGQIMADIANALDYAHNYGVIHLDVKPSNILFGDNKHAHLCDFGIAQFLLENADNAENIVGTVGYSAPEIWKLDNLTPQTDIYSFGIMGYQLLTGQLPFSNQAILRGMKNHITDSIPAVSAVLNAKNPHFKQLDEVIWKATAKHPADRYQTAGQFAEAFLEAFAKIPLEVLWELGGSARRRKSKEMNKMLLSLERNEETSYQFSNIDEVLQSRQDTYQDTRHSKRYQQSSMQNIGDSIAELEASAIDKIRATDILNQGQINIENFGVSLMPIPLPESIATMINQTHGMMITEIMDGSLAQQSGLYTGDILVSINHEKLETEADFSRNLKYLIVNGIATFQVIRAGAIMTI